MMRPKILSAVLAVLAATGIAAGQTTDAILSGTVTDSSGAVLVGAMVTARNVKTGVVTQTTTNESGVYLFAALQPGLYRLSAENAGFRKFIYNDVQLEVGARLSINVQLEVGTVAESVEVSAAAETSLGLVSTSVGGVVTSQRVQDLPIAARNALNLAFIVQAGLVGDNFNGNRIGTLNITLDGINVQDQRINSGVSSPIFTSVDRIEEFRIVTAPADAELGRGSGQIQMLTRSGTNEFHGSLFAYHRNTRLAANTWFNNQRGRDPLTGDPISPRNFLIRNQDGARIGGPIIKNRTFFHALYDGQRQRRKNSVTSTVYTATARQGTYRFFPGVRNGNALAAVPTVDLLGNAVRPATATGSLQEVILFGRDPNRLTADRTGVIQKMIELMPTPNNFRSGDGLNTAGYTWRRTDSTDFDHFNVKIDHLLNTTHRLAFSYTIEDGFNQNAFIAQPLPNSPGGNSASRDHLYSLTLTSTLRPNLLNEFRTGALRPRLRFFAPWEVAGTGLQPTAANYPYVPNFTFVSDPLNHENDPQGRISPVYPVSNNVTWLRGAHAFKGGFEARFVSTNGFNSFDVMPRANLGTGVPIQNLSSIAGIGQNLANAETLLNELSGSLSSVVQAFNSAGGPFLAGEGKQRTWRQREYSFFFKDDYKVTPNLTLNLGVRYEYYGVPYEANGKSVALVGGSGGLFGITGTGFADLFQPGRTAGSLTRLEMVGPGSPNPGRNLYAKDLNNWGPAAGLVWSLPWFGRNKTVLRLGYGISYERDSLRILDVVSGDQPGLRSRREFTSSSYMSLATLRLPLTPLGQPLDLVPLNDRTQTIRSFDSGLRSPYVQNWNLSIQRQITKNTTLDVRYVGSKGTRLVRGVGINEVNILETGILEAFRITQGGGNAPLFDRLFQGLNIPGLGVVDGVNRTGSDAVRVISTTNGQLAAHGAGALANYLNTTDQFTGQRGGLPRRAGFPENWITANPQFPTSRLTGNFASSTYNSLQVEVIRRFSAGWTFQGNYTWSRALGEEEGSGQEMVDDYRSLRNWRLDKRLLNFHATHVFRNNGTWELPFGPGKRLLGGRRGVLARLVERWQVGAIFNVFSGSPDGFFADIRSWNNVTDNTPVAVADVAKSTGSLRKTGNGVVYFDGLRQITDPSRATLTTLNGIRDRSTLMALTDASGRLLMVNPTPGVIGNIASRLIEGPGSFRLDVNLIKRIQITERKNLELRADALNFSNSPQFDNPNTDINSPNFGRITGTSGGNRIIEVGIRFNF